MNKINVDLYGGNGLFGGKETPLEAKETYCDRAEQCTYYKNNTCLSCKAVLSPLCKFGKIVNIKGYTSRAKKYYDFKCKYQNDKMYNKLKYPNDRVAIIGDELHIRYDYGTVRKRTEQDESWTKDVDGYIITSDCMRKNVFIPLAEATNNLLFAIFSNKPRNIWGSVIEDYQNKVVPDIIQTLKRVAPEIHKRFIEEYPQFDKKPNYIGKDIYVNSLKPNTKFVVKGEEWFFDGECVSAFNVKIHSGSPWWLQNGDYAYVKIKVNDKMTIEVNDNSIIDENTRFV